MFASLRAKDVIAIHFEKGSSAFIRRLSVPSSDPGLAQLEAIQAIESIINVGIAPVLNLFFVFRIFP